MTEKIKPGGTEGEKMVAATVKVATDGSEKYSDFQDAIDAVKS